MVKDVELFVVLLILFIGVVLVFNARFIAKKHLRTKNENVAVNILKVFGFLLCVASLVFTHYIH